ncbi:hypothetical protein F2P79_014788 [Pimephales promelas]|nr:hypothetical protein F2P79_014788 [Pimephales promelas]
MTSRTAGRGGCFILVRNAPMLRIRISERCLRQLRLRRFYAYSLEPKQKEKLRSISGRSAFLWFRAAVSSPSGSSPSLQKRSKGVGAGKGGGFTGAGPDQRRLTDVPAVSMEFPQMTRRFTARGFG